MGKITEISEKFKFEIPQNIYLFIWFIAAFILRVVLNLNNQFTIGGDSPKYLLIADFIKNGFGYSLGANKPSAFGLPLYPYFLAGLKILFGTNIFCIQIAQAFLGALSCLIIYFIALEIFNRRVADVSLLIMTFYYFLIKQCGIIYPETLYIFFLTLSILFLIKAIKSPENKKNYILFGFLFALVILTNCGLLFFPFIVAVIIFLKLKSKKVLINTLTMLAVFLIPILIWTARNYMVFKEFILLPNKGGALFYSSWTPPEGKIFGLKTKDEVTEKGGLIVSESERKSYYYRKGWEAILANPKQALKLLVLKNLYFWSIFDWETLGNGTYNFSTAFILPFFIASFFFMKKKNIFYVLPFIILILYYVLLTNIFMGLPRYRMQIEPFLIILAAFGMVSWYEKSQHKYIFYLCIAVWLFVNIFLFTHSSLTKDLTKNFAIRIGIW